MKIQLSKEEKKDLTFILDMFIDTHDSQAEIYKREIKLAEKILKKLETYGNKKT